MQLRSAVSIVAFALVVACGGQAAPAVEDTGLLPAEYMQSGLPDPAHAWSTGELGGAAEVLAKFRPDKLPVFGGRKSGSVFARIVAPMPDDPSQPIGTRFGARAERVGALQTIAKLYTKADPQQPIRRELIEMWGALVDEQAVMEPMVEPFLASFGSDDPQRDARLDGFAKIRDGLGQMLLGCAMVARDPRLTDDDRRALVAIVTRGLPRLVGKLTPERQQEIRTRLTELVDATTGPLHDDAVGALRILP